MWSQQFNPLLANYTTTGANYSTAVTETTARINRSLLWALWTHSPQSVMCFFCLVAPHWFAFLDEGPDPLLSIPECQVVHHHLGGRGVRYISALSHLSLEEKQERSQSLKVFTLMIHYHENSSNTKHEGKVKVCTSGKWPCRGLPPVGWLDTPAVRWLKSPPPDAPLAPPY